MTAAGAARAPFVLPAALAGRGLCLRRQGEADLPFLRRLYVSLRWDEVARVPQWDDAARLAFLEGQHALQHRHYETYYTRSDFLIVERDGLPIGRLALDRGDPVDLRVVDIAFLPEARGLGFGAALLAAAQDEARAAGKRVSIHVEAGNPARHLYERLGFRTAAPEGPYLRMEWSQLNTAS